MCCRKKWNSDIFPQKNLFQGKKSQKRAKRPNKFLQPANLRWSQKKPKSQRKLFRPTTLKRGQFF